MAPKPAKKAPKASPIPDRPNVLPVDPNAPVQAPPPSMAKTNIQEWNRMWEEYNHERYKVDTGFQVNHEAQQAQLPIFLTERQHASRKRGKEQILLLSADISRACKSAVIDKKSTGGEAIEHVWSSMTREKREELYFTALQQVEVICPSQRFREEAPELTLEAMCGGKGEGFNKLLNHFYREPELVDGEFKQETEYPLLRHEVQWEQLGLERDSELMPLSRAERAFQESMLNQKHLYLVNFVCQVLKLILGVKTTSLYIPKKLTSVATPPDVKARLRAKYTYVSDEGVLTPKPDACRDPEFVEWGGQWYCEIDDCQKSETAFDPADTPTGHKTSALLRQQIDVHKNLPKSQWAVLVQGGAPGPGQNLCAIQMFASDQRVQDLCTEFRSLAFSTRSPEAIGWFFTSLAIHLDDELETTASQKIMEPLAAVTKEEFTHQFITAFGIEEEAFIAGLPNTIDLIERGFEDTPGILYKYTGGKYPHFVLNKWLRQQCRLRKKHPTAFWGVLISLREGGPVDNFATLMNLDASVAGKYQESVRRLAFATGDPVHVGEYFVLARIMAQMIGFGESFLKWTTEKEFRRQFCEAWETTDEALDKWIENDLAGMGADADKVKKMLSSDTLPGVKKTNKKKKKKTRKVKDADGEDGLGGVEVAEELPQEDLD
ncbi:hypothetical protein P7C70_g3748, partial [Phenoliferia sp. Uapishka_3]